MKDNNLNMGNVLIDVMGGDLSPCEFVKLRRLALGLSQSDLCEVIAMKRENYSSIENGRSEITKKNAEKLAVALGVHPSEILYPEQRFNLSNELKEIKEKATSYLGHELG